MSEAPVFWVARVQAGRGLPTTPLWTMTTKIEQKARRGKRIGDADLHGFPWIPAIPRRSASRRAAAQAYRWMSIITMSSSRTR
jgi:hypothetical protein